ncbi:Ribosomal RNA small subunit methyltransferase E [Hordeum vulgare]|nr:Ribosomal RNA small subunit methyltransferase E [Hordeum vulgare]
MDVFQCGVGVGVIGVVVIIALLSVGMGRVVIATGPVMRFKMRLCSSRYHAFTCGAIVTMSAPIKNVGSVFLFFAATLVLRRSSLTSCFIINAEHLALDFSSLLAE